MKFRQLTGMFLTLVAITLNSQAESNSPNILFIIGDDMGVDAIDGFNIGEDHPYTPNLDKLRESGVSFTNLWAAPVCAASRASILTGKYGVNNGVNTVPGVLSTDHKSLFKEIDEQSEESYSNCLVGKWHLSRPKDFEHPFEHGVDNFMGVLNAGVSDYNEWSKYEDGETSTCNSYATQYFTDYAIDWIGQQTSPWFLWMAHVAPHAPFHEPPAGTYSQDNTGSNKQKYKAMIESMDFEIGRLLNSIPEDDYENTLVIFIGDNGTPGNLISDFPRKRGKQTIYQGGINVPMILSGKGVSRADEVENALINISDFYATLAQIVNPDAYPEGNINDSYSFKHLLDNSDGENRSYNYMEMGANATVENDKFTVRNNRYKLLELGDGQFEMYDLQADTFELNNLLLSELSGDILEAKDELISLLSEIKGEDISIPEDETNGETTVGESGAYPIVHTGVSDYYDEDSEIEAPDESEILFWQDAGNVHNSPSYTDNGDNTITDEITGLMWQKDMGEKISFADAVEKAKDLELGNYDDWRIPSIKELYSLILFSGQVKGAGAITPFIDTDYFIQPLGDVNAGEREIDAQTWSSTHYTGLTMRADTTLFGVNFVDGRIKGYPKYKPKSGAANKMYFRMVRGNTDYGKNLFIDNADGTVTDSASMLMWQQADDGTARDWLSSIEYCEQLNLAGYDDWHLPNSKELQSLVDYSRSPESTNSAAIDPVFSVSEIEDPEGNAGHFPYFWSTTTHLDGPNPYSGGAYLAFGKALGKMNDNLMDVHGAGAQRSDPKAGNPSDYPEYHGPQGDLQMVFNHCRCVRSLSDENTGILNYHEEKIEIYPNPTGDDLNLIWSEPSFPVEINVYNTEGKMVHSETSFKTNTSLVFSDLGSGIYLIQVNDRKMQFTKKFVLRRD